MTPLDRRMAFVFFYVLSEKYKSKLRHSRDNLEIKAESKSSQA